MVLCNEPVEPFFGSGRQKEGLLLQSQPDKRECCLAVISKGAGAKYNGGRGLREPDTIGQCGWQFFLKQQKPVQHQNSNWCWRFAFHA